MAVARCSASTERIWLNMSLGTLVSTSTLRLGDRPRSRNFWIGGIPWPIIISTGEASETVPPVSTIIWISVSFSVVQWMYVVSGPSRPASPISWSFASCP